MNRRANGNSSTCHSRTAMGRNGFSDTCTHHKDNGVNIDTKASTNINLNVNSEAEPERPKRKGGSLLAALLVRARQITFLVFAAMAGVALYSLSSVVGTEIFVESDSLLPRNHKYDICFVSSAFASSAQESDSPADMSKKFQKRYNIGFIFFTNLPDIQTPGWTKVVQSYPYAYVYKRFKTHSGALKFMSWREPVVQQHCSFVFYIDATFEPVKDAKYYQSIRDRVMQSHGYGLALHPQHQNGIYYEFELILENQKDIMKNILTTIHNLKQQSDFRNEVPVYDNAFLCYDPKSIIYQNISNQFWSHYALEQDSWRDQPWWAYTISRYPETPPYIIPTRAETMAQRGKKGMNGHHYNETSEGTASKHRRRGHPPIDSCFRFTSQSKAGALPSNWPNALTDTYSEEREALSRKRVKPLERHWTKLLAKMSSSSQSKRILDVGANKKFYASLLSSPSIRGSFVVDIFEPNKKHVLRLCESIRAKRLTSGAETHKKKTPHFNVYPYGLSNDSEMAVAYLDTWRPNSTFATVVETTTLDDIAQERGWLEQEVDHHHMFMLKMDAEHIKAKALLGAKKIIHRHLSQYVFLELMAADDDDGTTRESIHLLVDAGYRLEGQGWSDVGILERSPWAEDANLPFVIENAAKKKSQEHMHLLWSLKQ